MRGHFLKGPKRARAHARISIRYSTSGNAFTCTEWIGQKVAGSMYVSG